MPRKAPTKQTEAVPLNLHFTFDGKTVDIPSTNLLATFRELKIEPTKIKTPARFEVKYNSQTCAFVLNVVKLRRFALNDLTRQLLAKQFGVGLGIPYKLYT